MSAFVICTSYLSFACQCPLLYIPSLQSTAPAKKIGTVLILLIKTSIVISLGFVWIQDFWRNLSSKREVIGNQINNGSPLHILSFVPLPFPYSIKLFTNPLSKLNFKLVLFCSVIKRCKMAAERE